MSFVEVVIKTTTKGLAYLREGLEQLIGEGQDVVERYHREDVDTDLSEDEQAEVFLEQMNLIEDQEQKNKAFQDVYDQLKEAA